MSPQDSKKDTVSTVFDSVASKYDLMNDLMSFGMHRMWKKKFLSFVKPNKKEKILDVAGGTGDIAFRVKDACPDAEVLVCDINHNMILNGISKAMDKGYYGKVQWVCGEAENLPFDDDSFDCYTIAFGIRNVHDLEHSLEEAYRVLKPGGRFICMEFAEVNNEIMSKCYDFLFL